MTDFWFDLDESKCPCHGNGWAFIQEEWQECFVHFIGQMHPDSRALLLDDPASLKEEEHLSHLRWRVRLAKDKIAELQQKLVRAQQELIQAELELNNRKPTLRLPAVRPEDPVLEVDELSSVDGIPIE